MEYARPINRLVSALKKLPGVGPRSAQRMAWHVLDAPYEEVVELARALVRAKKGIGRCGVCCNYTDADPCPVCADPKRDAALVCVVEAPEDVTALERAGGYNGLYHVLGGAISATRGKGPERLSIEPLVKRIAGGGVREVILATNPTLDGDTTALYVAEKLEPFKVRLTRPARGLPGGADIDYLDGDTLTRAIQSRGNFKNEP